MIPALKNFIKQISILSIVLLFIGLIVFNTILKEYYIPVCLYLLFFFYLFTITVHYILLKSSKKRISQFSSIFMLLLTFKLIVYFLIIIFYLLVIKNNIIPFTIVFIILYFIYTAFEVFSIVNYLKKQS